MGYLEVIGGTITRFITGFPGPTSSMDVFSCRDFVVPDLEVMRSMGRTASSVGMMEGMKFGRKSGFVWFRLGDSGYL